jgi:hypothetical protein
MELDAAAANDYSDTLAYHVAADATPAASHLILVPRAFYLDHVERFGVRRAPAAVARIGAAPYLRVDDKHLQSFAEDAIYHADLNRIGQVHRFLRVSAAEALAVLERAGISMPPCLAA